MLRHRQSGVSLVELIIGIAILALLMALGIPEYSTFLNNSRVRATAETLVGGLNMARAEAVKRNRRVEFVQTSEEPLEILVDSIDGENTGKNWIVREEISLGSYRFIEGKSGAEGSGKLDDSPVNVVSNLANGQEVTFTGFGALASAQTITFDISNPTGGACASGGGPIRCLRVVVSSGGQVRICDPNVTAAKDTRAC